MWMPGVYKDDMQSVESQMLMWKWIAVKISHLKAVLKVT
jgi:hypothetical protein